MAGLWQEGWEGGGSQQSKTWRGDFLGVGGER